jgi:mannose-1-phosphate guanylyltransferase/mannose-6-phosphate isomerase
MSYTAVILCGGNGSRLYPLSRENCPKQYLRLVNKHSLLQNTLMRLKGCDSIYLVLNKNHKDITMAQIKELHEQKLLDSRLRITLVLEPMPRNTAAAIAFMCNLVKNTKLLFLPCDHIYDEKDLMQAINEAVTADQVVTTFGIKIKYPETGFGYLLYDNGKVKKFVEKPNLEKATEYFNSGKYFWNSGVFMLKSTETVRLLEEHLPGTMKVLSKLNTVMHKHDKDPAVVYIDEKYAECENISIDYGLMEKLPENTIYMVKYSGIWSDIGSFSSLTTKEDQELVLHESSGCYVSSKKLVLLNHVENLAIVDTDDALLVSCLDHSQDVKKVYEKVAGRKEVKYTNVSYNSWGHIKVLNNGDYSNYKVSECTVYAGCVMELDKDCTLTVLDGVGEVCSFKSKRQLTKGQVANACGGEEYVFNSSGHNLVVLKTEMA